MDRTVFIIDVHAGYMASNLSTTGPASETQSGIQWRVSESTLEIRGNGRMKDFKNSEEPPWSNINYDSVVISEGVTHIGDWSFSCSHVVRIALPESVKSIGEGAFIGCGELKTINMPGSLESIGGYAFASCSSLTELDIPDSVSQLGDNVFRDASKLTLTIPSMLASHKKALMSQVKTLIIRGLRDWMPL